ncbi:hypothetical protein PF005_g11053 [Phytophthora fragariae]|uniref:Uncharacterized protein n=1 Tax=Phytophthora fragariae TaxID=53985 RepID=A0A6A3Y2I6_9STRA|nr:hypothetical protein PF003_g32077 [Phytophthora fragariae]KAE8938147.1 hypothetical protein PF009_g11958 [Phytophthora fragariae]KAE9112928.1 hypothetical protein PF007_g10916 [Phytophthora fragariae]KAE9113157.1 hypothetical protein PF010_g10191 [Phytophthora fragariae]KAE9145075.1 hypothetical protein PF006_g10039 [Phytophthora fragariae]
MAALTAVSKPVLSEAVLKTAPAHVAKALTKSAPVGKPKAASKAETKTVSMGLTNLRRCPCSNSFPRRWSRPRTAQAFSFKKSAGNIDMSPSQSSML